MSDLPSPVTTALIERFASSKPLRTGSLIVSIFGDSVAPRGGVVWLGSLIKVLAPLGISERLVRTAVYRLAQNDILTSEQVGRRSYYALTSNGRRQFDEASARIYAGERAPWTERWCLVLTTGLAAAAKTRLRNDLAWLGFGPFGADLLAHPQPDYARLQEHLRELGLASRVVLLEAQSPPGVVSGEPSARSNLRALVASAWDLAALADAYERYLAWLRPLHAALQAPHPLNPADAFYIRSFMIHEYRKVLLRDPALPHELLPTTWHGHDALQLTRDVYRQVVAAAEAYSGANLQNQAGPLPEADAQFAERFGGLHDVL